MGGRREICKLKFKAPQGVDLSKKKPIGRDDRSLLLKLGYLLNARKIPEWLIDNACQAVLHHNGEVGDRIKYFTKVLFEGAQKKGIRLPALLATVTVPEELLTPAQSNGHPVSKPV